MKNRKKFKSQSGVALVFALGILSLLMVIGVGFVTNMLINRRVAANNAALSQTETILKSTHARLMTLLKIYAETGRACNTPLSELKSETPDGISDTLADVFVQDSDNDFDPNTNGTTPHWIFLKNGPQSDSSSEIIGRYAFASAKLKPRFDVDYCYVDGGAPNGRLGKNASEMVPQQIDDSSLIGIPFPDILSPDSNPQKWGSYEAMHNTAGTYSKDDQKTLKKFLNINTSASPEAYRACSGTEESNPQKMDQLYHRFNLARTDWDTLTVDDLFRSEKYAFYSDTDKGTVSEVADSANKNLPFLMLIGNDKGSFADLTARRKQIAANLLAYNQTADKEVPSDVTPSTWGDLVKNGDTLPTYTGNKKTPYIDSFGFVGTVSTNLRLSGTDAVSVPSAGASVTFDGRWLGNIVSVYKMKESELKEAELSLSATVLVQIEKIDCLLECTVIQAGVSKTVDQTVSVSLSDKFSETQTVSGTFSKTAFSNGYRSVFMTPDASSNKIQLTATISESTLKDKVEKEITLDQGAKLTDVKIKSLSIAGLKVELTPLRAALKYGGKNGKYVDFANIDSGTGTFTLEKSFTLFNCDGSSNTLSPLNRSFAVGGIYCFDPRQNLNPGDWQTPSESEKFNFNSFEDDLRKKTFNTISGKFTDSLSSLLFDNASLEIDTAAIKAIDQRNPSKAGIGKDKEEAEVPGWVGDGANQHLSTAYIRQGEGKDNAGGMMSPWELGFIHRGAKWETINLSNAAKPDDDTKPISPEDFNDISSSENSGTSYDGGDGGILEMIKMTDKSTSYGKMDITLFDNTSGGSVEPGAVTYKLLFHNYPSDDDYLDDTMSNIGNFSPLGGVTGGIANLVTNMNCDKVFPGQGLNEKDRTGNNPNYRNRAQLLFRTGNDGFYNAWGALTPSNKAAADELAGKTLNLLKVGSVPDEYRLMIIAQSIKDVGGNGMVIELTKHGTNGVPVTQNCEIGKFDSKLDGEGKTVYFDEITGEIREIVTIKRNSATGRFFIDERKRIY